MVGRDRDKCTLLGEKGSFYGLIDMVFKEEIVKNDFEVTDVCGCS